MPLAKAIVEDMTSPQSSVIRKMYDEGAALKKKFGNDAVSDFSLGNPDLDPPPEVTRAIRAHAALVQKGKHGYMPNAGYPETRAAMAEKITQEQGVETPWENIVMTCGAGAALNCIFKAILEPQDEVIVPAPYFPDYFHYIANHGGRLVPVPVKSDFSLDLDAIKTALSPKTSAVLINSPNNPSGKIYSPKELSALAALLLEHGAKCGRLPYLVSDEPYRGIVYDGKEVAPVFDLYPETLVATSFAKTLSIPGERIGFIAVNPACADSAQVVAACTLAGRILGFINAPAFFQRVVEAAWKSSADVSRYRKRRDALMAILDEAGLEYARPEGAFYIFCKAPPAKKPRADVSDVAFCKHLSDHLVICAAGVGFGCPGWFRIAYCAPEEAIERSRKPFKEAVESW
jgi:aspartate aminotransferase